MTTRKLQGPLGGDYQTDGAGNAVLLNSYPLTQEDDVPLRLADYEARVTAAECTFSPAAARVVVVDWASGAGASTRRLAFTWPLSPALAPVAQPVAISSPDGLAQGGY